MKTRCFNDYKHKHRTRLQSEKHYKKNAFYAIHHLHPKLLKTFWFEDEGMPRFVNVDKVKHLGLFNAHGGTPYTTADLIIKNGEKLVARFAFLCLNHIKQMKYLT